MSGKRIPKIRFKGFETEWVEKKFEDVFDMLANNTLSRDALNYDRGLAKNIHYGDILTKYSEYLDVNCEKVPYINDDDIARKYMNSHLLDGDIVIADTAEDESVGKCTEIIGINEIPIVSGLHTMPCRPRVNYAPKYMGYYLNSNIYHHKLLPLMQGVKVTSISRAGIKDTILSLSNEYDEQEKIGAFLSSFDEIVGHEYSKLQKLKILKNSMLEKMFPKVGENMPEIRFSGFDEAWEQKKFKEIFEEHREKTEHEDEDILLSCAINGMFLNSELFGHFRGSSTVGYLKVKKNDLILSAQNLHLGNANVNLRFEHGIISPAYKVYKLLGSHPCFVQAWVKKEETKKFFLKATTEGASQCRKNIEWDTLHNQEVFIPAYEEQKMIGCFFTTIDQFISLHQQKLEILKKIKSACLERMFV